MNNLLILNLFIQIQKNTECGKNGSNQISDLLCESCRNIVQKKIIFNTLLYQLI